MPSTPWSIAFNFQGRTAKPNITKGIHWSIFSRNLTSTSSSLARYHGPRLIVLSGSLSSLHPFASGHTSLCSWQGHFPLACRALPWPALTSELCTTRQSVLISTLPSWLPSSLLGWPCDLPGNPPATILMPLGELERGELSLKTVGFLYEICLHQYEICLHQRQIF